MSTPTSRDVLIELIGLARDSDEAGLNAWNLPANVSALLQRVVGIGREVEQLHRITARREAEEAESETLLLQLIQQAGLARSDQATET